jgi:hypothetical protein
MQVGNFPIKALGCLGCVIFPAAVMILVLTYQQKEDQPGSTFTEPPIY